MALSPTLQAAVDWALETRPTSYGDRFRAASKPLVDWLTNCAYWRANPKKPPTIQKGDKVGADDWNAMRAEINRRLLAEAPPVLDPSRPRWPLPTPPVQWGSGASFGARRPAKKSKPQTRYHAGIDLDAGKGDVVLAPEGGTVVGVGVGWEAPTKAVILQLDSGVTMLLGGVKAAAPVTVGQRVEQGQVVAEVEAYPLGDTMVHVQLYSGTRTKAWVQGRTSWKLGAPQPDGLLDPTEYLAAAAANTPQAPADALVGFGAQPVDPSYESAEESEGAEAEGGTAVWWAAGGLAIIGGGVGLGLYLNRGGRRRR